MKRILAGMILAAGLVLAVLLAPAEAWAQQADWQARERQCLQACPRFPRFSGVETDAQYKARMQAQAAYDQCKLACARKVGQSFSKSFTPISKSAREYYERNGN